MKNEVKTILFAGLIAAMVLLPFSVIDISIEKTTNGATQMLRDSKATSFNEIPYFEEELFVDEIIQHVAHRR